MSFQSVKEIIEQTGGVNAFLDGHCPRSKREPDSIPQVTLALASVTAGDVRNTMEVVRHVSRHVERLKPSRGFTADEACGLLAVALNRLEVTARRFEVEAL